MVKAPAFRTPDFWEWRLQGYFFKELARALLDESGYATYPTGFESFFSALKYSASERVRSIPDLLVVDVSSKKEYFVEVKSRSWQPKSDEVPFFGKDAQRLASYKKFWPNSVLVLVLKPGFEFTPGKTQPWIYAQEIEKVNLWIGKSKEWKICKKPKWEEKTHIRLRDFEKFEGIFTKVQSKTLDAFRPYVDRGFGLVRR